MKIAQIKILDTVVLLSDFDDLEVGLLGTVVEKLGDNVFEVEFIDEEGRTVRQESLPGSLLLPVHNVPLAAST